MAFSISILWFVKSVEISKGGKINLEAKENVESNIMQSIQAVKNISNIRLFLGFTCKERVINIVKN